MALVSRTPTDQVPAVTVDDSGDYLGHFISQNKTTKVRILQWRSCFVVVDDDEETAGDLARNLRRQPRTGWRSWP